MFKSISAIVCAFSLFSLTGCHQSSKSSQIVATPAGYLPPHKIELDTRSWQEKADAIDKIADAEAKADAAQAAQTAPAPSAKAPLLANSPSSQWLKVVHSFQCAKHYLTQVSFHSRAGRKHQGRLSSRRGRHHRARLAQRRHHRVRRLAAR